jgi:hypothetical protein
MRDLNIGTGDRNPPYRTGDRKQGAALRAWMDGHVLPAFDGRILAIDTAVDQTAHDWFWAAHNADR